MSRSRPKNRQKCRSWIASGKASTSIAMQLAPAAKCPGIYYYTLHGCKLIPHVSVIMRRHTLYVLTLSVFFRAICAFLDAHQLYGSWHSYSTCSLFLAPELEPGGAQHHVTCGLRLLATNTTVLGQSLACDGKTPATHGKDFIYMEIAQQGSVVTRLPGVHRGRGVHEFSAWQLVSWDSAAEMQR